MSSDLVNFVNVRREPTNEHIYVLVSLDTMSEVVVQEP